MEYRNASLRDIASILLLQKKYHVSTVSEEDKQDGFVTTLFSEKQLKDLIEKENGLAIACHGERIVAYVMAASWQFWEPWPLFQKMIADLPNTRYLDTVLSTNNSYQYGPVCIDKEYRGTEVLPNLFEFSRLQMKERFPILITFINKINPRSFKAHTEKLCLDVIKSFEFNNNQYYELGYDMSKKTRGSNL
ncbi:MULTISPECIES: GNAT family acetyltransferase [unclassified Sedimentibacter]|uniref:GNAT family acetyltransferase n=1 Tax=unclassified Sedimentibacter TaxID=2649220 RepID=UPI0027E0C675|nr:GNAT family acetyltransferase [Sedimentibacter sp. MB35-C1]WMJ78417.1 GNAT family acetyltransferase [Sedimentibacter sp. MB35-C1]